jgi:hypothetical protein
VTEGKIKGPRTRSTARDHLLDHSFEHAFDHLGGRGQGQGLADAVGAVTYAGPIFAEHTLTFYRVHSSCRGISDVVVF